MTLDSATGRLTGEVLRCMPSSPLPSGSVAPTVTPQKLPVTVGKLPGWTFGTPGDDKFPATKGSYFLSVNVRPLSELEDWSGGAGSDRPRSQVVHVGKNYFVTLQPADPDTPLSVLKELEAGLRYAPRWTEQP